jgi:hypothetical protein
MPEPGSCQNQRKPIGWRNLAEHGSRHRRIAESLKVAQLMVHFHHELVAQRQESQREATAGGGYRGVTCGPHAFLSQQRGDSHRDMSARADLLHRGEEPHLGKPVAG